MSEILNNYKKKKFIGPIRRWKYKQSFNLILSKEREGLEFVVNGLKFSLVAKDEDTKKHLKVVDIDTGLTLAHDGVYRPGNWRLRRQIKKIIYAYGWNFHQRRKEILKNIRKRLTDNS